MGERMLNHSLSRKSTDPMAAFAETHAARAGLRKWDRKARPSGLRLFSNPAREQHRNIAPT
eukprot:2003907-Pyramimonas_sp.AAC.1